MKIAVMSDFHFGYNDDALTQAGDALRKARGLADFVIAAGDLFDSRIPRQEVVNDSVRLLKDHNRRTNVDSLKITVLEGDGGDGEKAVDRIPVIAIYGTHERRTKGLVNAVQVLDSAGLVLNAHARTIVVEKGGERVAVQGMGGVPEEQAAEHLRLLSQKPLAGAFNIFVFHQSLKEVISVGEGMSASELPPGFDVYVDGHIHWAQELKSQGKRILLPGSTVVTQMKESETGPKGFYLLDTASGEASFVKIESRQFFFSEIAFENASPSEVERKAREKLAEILVQAGGRVPLVKLKLRGTLEKGIQAQNIDLGGVEKDFAERMALAIDKEFASEELREKIELLRRLRDEKKSVREMGLAVLKKKLSEAGNGGAALKAEELFELLAEGEVGKALEIV
ncbi:MAG: metallophosphoesterase family protein [Candidatus Micrarchaeota archaeon]|nr:metallophosphoesterase family protein [Candidatus Micrarchaeota archaeon]